MRYLKAIGQDLGNSGKANTVVLRFFEENACQPNHEAHAAFAVDVTGDGQVDYGVAGDIDNDGRKTLKDRQRLKAFADVFLQLNWFNPADGEQRYLKIFAENYHHDGSPNIVKLQFHEVCEASGAHRLIHSAAGYDGDNDGVFESFTNSDIDRDGIASKADKELIRALIRHFLAFNWYDA